MTRHSYCTLTFGNIVILENLPVFFLYLCDGIARHAVDLCADSLHRCLGCLSEVGVALALQVSQAILPQQTEIAIHTFH